MMYVPVSAFYASLLAIGYLYLTAMVIRQRLVSGVGIGNGGDAILRRLSRVHANYNEYVPLGLILLILLELNSEMSWALHVGATSLLLGRLFHAIGFSRHEGKSWQRQVGMILTLVSLLFMALANLTLIYWIRLL
jgi:uncharacterized membrane protein YecN with MAPEG domain